MSTLGTIWTEVAPTVGSEGRIQCSITNTVSGSPDVTKLYGVTKDSALLLEWNDTNAWSTVASSPGSSSETPLIVSHSEDVYLGRNGELYKWNGTNAWVSQGSGGSGATDFWGIASYSGDIYVVAQKKPPYPYYTLLKWGGSSWSLVGGASSRQNAVIVHDGDLYTCGASGTIYKYDGSTFSSVYSDGTSGNFEAMASYDGTLYVVESYGTLYSVDVSNGTVTTEAASISGFNAPWLAVLLACDEALYLTGDDSNEQIYKWTGTAWSSVITPDDDEINPNVDMTVMTLTDYDDCVYGGAGSDAKLYRLDRIAVTHDTTSRRLSLIGDDDWVAAWPGGAGAGQGFYGNDLIWPTHVHVNGETQTCTVTFDFEDTFGFSFSDWEDGSDSSAKVRAWVDDYVDVTFNGNLIFDDTVGSHETYTIDTGWLDVANIIQNGDNTLICVCTDNAWSDPSDRASLDFAVVVRYLDIVVRGCLTCGVDTPNRLNVFSMPNTYSEALALLYTK